MRAAECEDPETGEEVQVPAALVVVEIATLAAHVPAVEPECREDPGQLRVHEASVSEKFLALLSWRTFARSNGTGCTSSLCHFEHSTRRRPRRSQGTGRLGEP
jgi:hypothetical protein